MKELLQSLCTEVCEGKVREAFTNACWLIRWLLLTLYLLELDSPLNHFDSKSQVSRLSEVHIAWYVHPLNKQLTFNLSSFQSLHQELRESRSWKRPRSRSQSRAGTGWLSPFTSSSTQLTGPEALKSPIHTHAGFKIPLDLLFLERSFRENHKFSPLQQFHTQRHAWIPQRFCCMSPFQ